MSTLIMESRTNGHYLDGGGRHQLRLSSSYLSVAQIEEGIRRLSDFISAQ